MRERASFSYTTFCVWENFSATHAPNPDLLLRVHVLRLLATALGLSLSNVLPILLVSTIDWVPNYYLLLQYLLSSFSQYALTSLLLFSQPSSIYL